MSIVGFDLVRLLAAPTHVAIVGASQDPRKPAGRPVDYMQRYGYQGRLTPVTSRVTVLGGLPTVSQLSDLEPGSVDVALLTLPSPLVLEALRDAEQLGVQAAIVIGSGFEDRASQIRIDIDRFACESDIRIIGPNCLGSLAMAHSAFLTFSSVVATEQPRLGRIGMVTQSGALGNSLLQTLIRRQRGPRALGEHRRRGRRRRDRACHRHAERPSIDAVGLFLEGITRRRLAAARSRCST